MSEKIKISILFLILLGALAGGFFWYFSKHAKNVTIINSAIIETEHANKTKSEIEQKHPASEQKLFVSAWLPYWAKDNGVASLKENVDLFDEVDIFDFGVDQDGNLVDNAKVENAPWTELRKNAAEKNVSIVPTVIWADAQAMHRVFTNSDLLAKHVANIVSMLDKEHFSGVDIDYEGKDVADRDNFTFFLKALRAKLSSAKKTLQCTVEARWQDDVPTDWNGTKAMAWANDFSVLNDLCDSVRVMTYDQAFQAHGEHQVFEDSGTKPYVANADKDWVEKVMRYALTHIAPEKLTLGIPTYGWEFRYEKISNGYRYTRIRSISYPDAVVLVKSQNVAPVRNAGGERMFTYAAKDGNHIVVFSDAQAINDKISLAKNLHLKGVSIFKLDGLVDPELFSILKQ